MGITLLGMSVQGYAQPATPSFTKEISFITDNDNYLLQKRDGYYTNGFYFSYQHLIKKKLRHKTIMRYELGQMIFNPYKYSITDPEQMDRPFAGYLYVKANRSRFFEKGNNLQYGISVGILGPASGAQQTQRNYHKLINIYEVKGWGYQLKNEPGVSLNVQYSHPLSGMLKSGDAVDLHAIAKANAGNIFSNATAGFLFRIGLMENSTQSVAWNSRLHAASPSYLHKKEFFVFFQPEIMYQAYNATLQGGLFRDDKGPVTASPEPLIYQQRIGIMYAKQRITIVLADVHRTKEAKQMRRKENYGSITLGYRLK
ncbi:MAG: lipid A deacylase LpxR family protein [Chitinophagaceae bacterium]